MAKATKKSAKTSRRPGNRAGAAGLPMLAPARVFTNIAALNDDDLKGSLDAIQQAYLANEQAILGEAYQRGGGDPVASIRNVTEMTEAFRDFDAARFELSQRQLDLSNARYASAKAEALRVTADTRAAIQSLQNITAVLNGLTTIVSIIGRLLILF
jgi:hypothetical protein